MKKENFSINEVARQKATKNAEVEPQKKDAGSKKEVSNANTTKAVAVAKETKKEVPKMEVLQTKKLTIDEQLRKIEDLKRNAEKFRKLKAHEKEFKDFVDDMENQTPILSIRSNDSNNSFSVPVPRVFDEFIKIMFKKLDEELKKVSNELYL